MKVNVLKSIESIAQMYEDGVFGSKELPEDTNPHLAQDSEENALYFTLPTALNYQRNSYSLWVSAKKTYLDESTNFLFNPKKVAESDFGTVQAALTKYRLALQKNKQTAIWCQICQTLNDNFAGSVLTLCHENHDDVIQIRKYLQIDNKDGFPYLSGKKLCNYWLFVLDHYTSLQLKNVSKISIAADRHVIKASRKLGLITAEEENSSKKQDLVITAWFDLLKDTKYRPVDFQTPIWFWGRSGCPAIIEK